MTKEEIEKWCNDHYGRVPCDRITWDQCPIKHICSMCKYDLFDYSKERKGNK